MPAASLFPNRFAKPMVHVFLNPLYQSRLLLRFWPTEAPRQHDGMCCAQERRSLCGRRGSSSEDLTKFVQICRAPPLLFFFTNGKRKL